MAEPSNATLEKTPDGTFATWNARGEVRGDQRDWLAVGLLLLAAILIPLSVWALVWLVLLGPLIVILRPRLGSVARPIVRDLPPEPRADPVFPVNVRLTYRGIVVGIDQGVISFSDGWLHYEGIGFSCSIRNCDCNLSLNPREIDLGLGNDRRMEMGYVRRWEPKGKPIAFRVVWQHAEAWARARAPEGESVFPPLRFSRRPRVWSAAYAFGAAYVGLWALVWVVATNSPAFVGFTPMLAVAVGVWGALALHKYLPIYRALLPEERDRLE